MFQQENLNTWDEFEKKVSDLEKETKRLKNDSLAIWATTEVLYRGEGDAEWPYPLSSALRMSESSSKSRTTKWSPAAPFSFFRKIIQTIGKRFKCPLEYTKRIRYCNTVIGYGNAEVPAAFNPRENFPPVCHTSSALNNQLVIAEIFRQIVSLINIELEFSADVLRQPSRYFYPTDVFYNRMMRT